MADRPHDLRTVLAIGMIVYLIKNVVHELIGHGGVAVWVGAVPTAVSSAWWDASYDGVSVVARQWVRAGGTLANLVLAAGSLSMWPSIRRHASTNMAYFVWLTIVANLLSGGGYMMVDPVANFGDWGGVLEQMDDPALPRIALIVVGITVSLFAVFWGRRAVEVFLPSDDAARTSAIRRLCWGPYFVGCAVFIASAAFNPEGPKFMLTVTAATVGGTAWLAWFLPFVVKAGTNDPKVVTPSVPWMIGGVTAALFTLFVLGPSIRF